MLDREEQSLTANQVFGVKKSYELINYIERPDIDGTFVEALVNGKHVSLYGASKTGKSSLIEKHVGDAERLYIQCSKDWKYDDFIDSLLNVVYGRQEQSTEIVKEIADTTNASGKIGGSAGGFSTQLSRDFFKSERSVVRIIDQKKYNLLNLGDLIRLFDDIGFGKSTELKSNLFIVIDDFHRLSDDAQIKIANVAKMLFDNVNVVLICVGIWAEEHKLSSLCSELMGRCEEINCNVWGSEQLEEVAEQGSRMLNIEFPKGFSEATAKLSCGSVFIVQECCAEACRQLNVTYAKNKLTVLSDTVNAHLIIKKVASRACNFTDFHNKLMYFCKQNLEVLYVYRIILNQYASSIMNYEMEKLQSKIEAGHPTFRFDSYFAHNACLKLNQFLRSRNFVSILEVHRNRRGRQIITLIDRTFLLWLRGRKQELLDDIDRQIDIHQRLSVSKA